MEFKDQVDLALKIVGIVGGLFAAFRGIYELRETRKQKQRDLRWKQANTAYALIKEMLASQGVNDTITMMDWDGREYEVTPGQKSIIMATDIQPALRITQLQFQPKEMFIRDCFDAFLFHIVIIEHAIRNGLIEFRDVKFPIQYYWTSIQKLELESVLENFMRAYLYHDAKSFFQRFKHA